MPHKVGYAALILRIWLLWSNIAGPMPAHAKPAHPRLTDLDMLDVREVAQLLHMPASTVLEFARRGVIPGHKLGRRWIFLRDEIEASVRQAPSRRQAPAASAIDQAAAVRSLPRRYPRAAPPAETVGQSKLFG
jgi:excisionase family DNA binding protein